MTRKILALLAAAPLALGAAGLAHADQAVSDTRISNHSAPLQGQSQRYQSQPYQQPYYATPMPTTNGDGVSEDTGRISAHEANPQNPPGNTSNYSPPPLYMSPSVPGYVQTPTGSAGPQIEVISNEPYFQDDVPPYRR